MKILILGAAVAVTAVPALAIPTEVNPNHVGAIEGRLTAAPEPAAWALMVAGFGLVGAARRRRTRMVAA